MNHIDCTVELPSKGPGRKGNPPIRKRISGPISHSFILSISILAIREFHSMGKIRPVPWNPFERSSTIIVTSICAVWRQPTGNSWKPTANGWLPRADRKQPTADFHGNCSLTHLPFALSFLECIRVKQWRQLSLWDSWPPGERLKIRAWASPRWKKFTLSVFPFVSFPNASSHLRKRAYQSVRRSARGAFVKFRWSIGPKCFHPFLMKHVKIHWAFLLTNCLTFFCLMRFITPTMRPHARRNNGMIARPCST